MYVKDQHVQVWSIEFCINVKNQCLVWLLKVCTIGSRWNVEEMEPTWKKNVEVASSGESYLYTNPLTFCFLLP